MMILTAGVTDIGIARAYNQDSYLIKTACSERGAFVFSSVCDGLGGLSNGELASADTVRAFSNWFDHWLAENYRQADSRGIMFNWRSLLCAESRKIMDFSREQGDRMGTTFSGILISGNGEYIIGHVGDTRIYRISMNGSIRQLTQDHTVTAVAIRDGAMTREEAARDRRRHVLTQCIGVIPNPEVEYLRGKAKYGDIFLLCSDGFRNKLEDGEIGKRIASAFLEDEKVMENTLIELVEMAKTRKEKDNITATVLWVVSDASQNTSDIHSEETTELGFSVVENNMVVNTEEVIGNWSN